MILSDDEIKERIESPLNLLNRLKSNLSRAIHPSNSSQHPALPPSAGDIIDDLDDKLKNTSTRSKAAGILNAAMDELKIRIPDVQKPEKLAQIAAEMSKVISNHDNKPNSGVTAGQIIVYAPQVVSLDNFDIIDVAE